MSNYKKDEAWTEIWDALFWRFMHVHRDFFLQNPRLGMLIKTFDNWHVSRRKDVLEKADGFLAQLDRA
jgi:deoxyribodipyrimidine photolyase-related protein